MLIIDDLTVRIAGRTLIEGASVRIPEGSRVGLVGRNGTGKSTLFNVITGDHPAETGHVEMPSRWRIGRLAQNGRDMVPNLCRHVANERLKQSLLRIEIGVEGAESHAGPARDPDDRAFREPPLTELLPRRVEDLAEGTFAARGTRCLPSARRTDLHLVCHCAPIPFG